MTGYKEIKEELQNSKEESTKIKQQLGKTERQLANTVADLKTTKEKLQQIGVENLIKQEDERIKQLKLEDERKQQLKKKYKVQLIKARKPDGLTCKLIFNFYSFMNYLRGRNFGGFGKNPPN